MPGRLRRNPHRPITWDELRDGLTKNPTFTKVENDKSYYSGVQRLKEKGYCVSYKGRISTPENLKRFQDEVAAGRAVDLVVAPQRNKWAEAIFAFLKSRPDQTATFAEIITHLSALPEFSEKLKEGRSGNTYANSTLAAMVSRTKVLEKPRKAVYRLRKEIGDDSGSQIETGETLFGTSEAEAPEVRH